jgi:quercetin dioxygenase-like cupin family protein
MRRSLPQTVEIQMKPVLLLLLACAGGAFAAGPGQHMAHAAMPHAVTRAASTAWGAGPPMLPAGVEFAVLSGDPGKEGSFTIRLKMPPGYRVPRHWHPTDEAVTLLEGDLTLSMGEAGMADDAALAPGDFVNLPARMQHQATSTGGAVVQIQSMGPFAIHYVDPKDDPRNAGK